MALINPGATHQWAVYLDFDEVTDYLQFDQPPTGSDAVKLQRFINGACAQAQGPGGANRPLCPTRVTERHDGWSGEYLMLLFSPLLSLDLCREWQSAGGFVGLPESTPESPTEGVQVDHSTGRLMRTFAGYSWPRPFFPGSRNIEITYTAGFNPVPDDVWEATMELVAWKWRNSQQATRTAPLRGGGEYDTDTSGLYPGMPSRIADVLGGYRLPTIG